MANKVGKLIKEARLAADMTQEQLARKIGGGVSASDVSKVERGEADFTQEQLKKIAKATGVTQKSLLDAAKGTSVKAKSSASAKKTTTAKAKTPSNAGITMRVTATEKKLIEAYRLADSDTKKSAMSLLKGEGLLSTLMGGAGEKTMNSMADMIGDVIENFLDGKK